MLIKEWPADKVDRRAIADLVPYARNARTHSDAQVAQIAASMQEWGWTNPILVDETGMIIAGHGRVLAARKLGFTDAPVMVASGWSEAQKRAYVIADNKLALNAGWDMPALSAELGELAGLDFDLALTGFDDTELAGLLDKTAGLTDPDEVPPAPVNPVTRMGDLWICGNHRILCGDSTVETDVSHLLGSVKPHLMVTSPPYNQKINKFKPSGMHKEGDWSAKVGRLAYSDDMNEDEYQRAQMDALAIWFSFMADGASVFYNHKNRYRDKKVISPLTWLPGPFNLRQEIIWSRPGSVTQNARMFLPCDERIYWMTVGTGFYFNDTTEIKTWSSIWKIGLETNKSHAVGFPVELPRRCILACSRTSDAVFDPYCGSGTTMIAAEMEGRHAYCIELSEAYCDVIVKRWQAFTGEQATLEGDGRTFEQLSDERYDAKKDSAESYEVAIEAIRDEKQGRTATA